MKNYAPVLVLALLLLFLSLSQAHYPPIYRSDDEDLLHSGYAQLLDDRTEGAARASALFLAALRRDPASPYRWADFGAALLADGRTDQARLCYSRALKLGPKVAAIQLRAANFFLEIGDTQSALPVMAAVLDETAQYDSAIFSYYSRLELPPETILGSGIPPGARAAQSYFRSLLVAGNQAQLQPVWDWARVRGFVDDTMAGQYVTYLVGERALDRAASVWAAYLGPRAPGYGKSNFLFNGGFEFEPTGSALDWSIQPSNVAVVERDTRVVYAGARSLRITFRGGSYEGVSQIAIAGSGDYVLRARIRTEGIPAGSGPRFRIFDAENANRLNVVTAAFGGSTDWNPLEKSFAVRQPTGIVTVQLVNGEGASGTVWIDAVELVPGRQS